MQPPRCSFIFPKFGLPALALIVLLLSACLNKKDPVNQLFKNQLAKSDSLFFGGRGPEGLSILKKLRPQITHNEVSLSSYYYTMAEKYCDNPAQIALYADSAMLLFNDRVNIDQYPDEYYHAVLIKGDACLRTGKYAMALDFFDKAKRTLPKTNFCDDGSLASKMGVIYYGQKNFKQSARYWVESYTKLENCEQKATPENLFYRKQGNLDNIALCYEQCGMLDSARYYYNLDLKLINDAAKGMRIKDLQLNPARIVLYDNLGGLNLKLGNLAEAERYLNLCLAIPYANRDGARIPPLVKMAELSIKLGDYKKAEDAFKESKVLLGKFLKDSRDSEIRWNQVYAIFLAKTGKQDSAYYYLNNYITKKRYVDSSSTELYRLNVEREMQGIQQQQSILALAQQNKLRSLYLQGFAAIALLLFVIIYLIYRNLQKTKRTNKETTLQNQQLQQTLGELELVNKNYIRIMRVMAHDLRNPLSGMIGMATVLLMEDELNDDCKQMLQLIESTGMHSMGMINELLKTGLADENEQVVTEEIDLRSLLYDSVELLQFKATEKNQQIVFEGDNAPIMVNANHEKIWRVCNNLIVNAIKFSHEGGVIKAGIKADKTSAVIWIADNGIGIAPTHKDSIFEMFTPAKKTGTAGEQPFGLGLSICKRIIEKHNGKIWFESTVNAGTTFYIELPR